MYYTSILAGQHLCFNITEKEQIIVPDWYNKILEYTKNMVKQAFPMKIVCNSDSILSSCVFYVTRIKWPKTGYF